MMLMRTAKSCGSDAPMLASSLANFRGTTVSSKPGHRGEREVSRKTIARGRPGLLRCTCGDYARVSISLHTRLRVQWAPGFPCALYSQRGETVFAKLGRIAPRDCGGATSLRGATRRSNPFFLGAPMDCFACARNDGEVAAPRVAHGGEAWWGRKDSNLRSHKTTDLQSAPFATRDTSPQQHRNPTAGTAEIRAIDDAETQDPSHGLPVGRFMREAPRQSQPTEAANMGRDGLKLPLFGTHDTSLP